MNDFEFKVLRALIAVSLVIALMMIGVSAYLILMTCDVFLIEPPTALRELLEIKECANG